MDNPHDWTPGGHDRLTGDPTHVAATKAELLRALHRPGFPVTVPSAWDAASARMVVGAGFTVVATSSTAVAGSLGYDDGEAAPIEEMLDAIARIAASVGVPVTADVERGYGAGPRELVERLIAAGAAGCTLQDSDPRTGRLLGAGRQADYLAAVREAAVGTGVSLVINARIDTYLRAVASPSVRLDDVVARARRYLLAGADCVYPLLVHERSDIGKLVEATRGRVDVRIRRGTGQTPPPAELAELGVARISFGGSLHQASLRGFHSMLCSIRAGHDPLS